MWAELRGPRSERNRRRTLLSFGALAAQGSSCRRSNTDHAVFTMLIKVFPDGGELWSVSTVGTPQATDSSPMSANGDVMFALVPVLSRDITREAASPQPCQPISPRGRVDHLKPAHKPDRALEKERQKEREK